MEEIQKLIDRARVVAKAAVTYIALLSGVLVYISQTVVPDLPEPVGTEVGKWVSSGLAFLAGVVTIIRRVTPVEPDERGILPQ